MKCKICGKELKTTITVNFEPRLRINGRVQEIITQETLPRERFIPGGGYAWSPPVPILFVMDTPEEQESK
jgi:hypothetical protein